MTTEFKTACCDAPIEWVTCDECSGDETHDYATCSKCGNDLEGVD